MSLPLSDGLAIYISSITLNVQQKFGKIVDHITLQTKTGRFKKEIPGKLSPGQEHKEVFNPALELSPRDRLSISIQSPSRWYERTLSITIKQSEIMREAQDDGHEKKTYLKFHNNILVTIGVSRDSAASAHAGSSTTDEIPHDAPLPPTTSEILRICPRFRLLIIGNSGVGKSTLIRNVFKVQDVDVSEESRGQADIDREFVSADNGLFVLHDSLGLEAGECDNLDKVKRFISDRRRNENLKDRLHAVWVCLAIPYAKGRLLEAGMEEFLRDRNKILGDIPIVVVLTKLDLLDNALILALRSEGVMFKSMEEAQTTLQPRRFTFLSDYCTQPLLRAAMGHISHVAVSTKSGYNLEPTISELVKTTASEIERYIKADPSYAAATEPGSVERNAPWYIAGFAQRASIEAKMVLTIAIGKKKYWTGLVTCFSFSAEKVKEYLLVVHRDIVQVWNFNDPELALQGDNFKEALLDTSNLGVHDIRGAQAVLAAVTPLVSALVPLITDLTTIAIALPLAGAVALAKLCHEIYKSTQTIAKRFMAYIVDLIYVMKILFILAPQGSITSRDVALALEVYNRSTYRKRIHLELHDFSADSVMLPGGREVVVNKIETLVRRYDMTDEDVARLQSQIHAAPAPSS